MKPLKMQYGKAEGFLKNDHFLMSVTPSGEAFGKQSNLEAQ